MKSYNFCGFDHYLLSRPKSYVTSCWMNIDTCLLYCEHWRRTAISSSVDIVWTCVELVDDIKMQDFNSIITPWDVYITIVVSMLYYSAMMPLLKNTIFRNTRKNTLLTAQQQITPKMAHFASLQNCLNLLLPPSITCVFWVHLNRG